MPTLFHKNFSLGTIIYLAIIAIILGLLGSYVLFQARHIITGPVITLSEEPTPIQEGGTVTLTGRAINIVSLSLNGRTIYTDDLGNFTEMLVLPPGYTIMTLTARDRYGRTHSIERTYVRGS